jgi:hypothetical protein
MAKDFIFAQDSFSILLRRRSSPSFGGVWRNGVKIAVLVGANMYDLNGNLLGKLAAGDGSLPIAFKNLLSGKWAHAERALRRDGEEIGTARRQIGARAEPRDDRRASDSRQP